MARRRPAPRQTRAGDSVARSIRGDLREAYRALEARHGSLPSPWRFRLRPRRHVAEVSRSPVGHEGLSRCASAAEARRNASVLRRRHASPDGRSRAVLQETVGAAKDLRRIRAILGGAATRGWRGGVQRRRLPCLHARERPADRSRAAAGERGGRWHGAGVVRRRAQAERPVVRSEASWPGARVSGHRAFRGVLDRREHVLLRIRGNPPAVSVEDPAGLEPALKAKAAAALLALAACARAAGKEAAMEPRPWGETVAMCAGRFCADIPKVMRRAGTYVMRGVALEEKPWTAPVDKAFERQWAAELTKIEEIRSERIREQAMRSRSVAGEIVEKRTVAPRFESVCYYKNTRNLIVWVALRDCGPLGLALSRWGGANRKDELAASIAELGNAYHVRSDKEPWPSPGADWFYLDRGAVALPFREEEHMEAFFDGLGVRFFMQTETTAEPEKTGPVGRYKMAIARLGSGLTEASTIVRQDSRRKVA